MVKKRKYGDAWKDVQIDDNQFDAVFNKFIKARPEPVKSDEAEGPGEGTNKNETAPPHPTPKKQKRPRSRQAAPSRDFNRRANSLERDALPQGLFPGTSKKLYDALYLRTRGAVEPCRTIRATKRQMMEWAKIGSQNTLDGHLRHFLNAGLLVRSWEVGDNTGAIYEVLIPEEIAPPHPTPPHPTSSQKLGGGSPQKVVWGGVGQIIENKDSSTSPNTFLKTNTHDDDETFKEFGELLKKAAREVLGEDPPQTQAERTRWKEVGELLATELKQAAARAGSVSSVPAFLAAHLRRRFKASTSANPTKADRQLTKSQAATLTKEQRLVKMIKDLQRLHVGDAGYEQADLLEDLKYKCERHGIEWDEELVQNLLAKQ